MTYQDCVREAMELIEGSVGFTPKAWLVEQLLLRHPNRQAETGDQEFGDIAFYHLASLCVREAITRKAPRDPGNLRQLLLPGYNHVQLRYSIVRDGQQGIVAVESMTDDELWLKEGELRNDAKAKLSHADELRLYRIRRFGHRDDDRPA